MNYKIKASTSFLVMLIMLLSGCGVLKTQQQVVVNKTEFIHVGLSPYHDSNFKQVEVIFFTHQSKELVFRVLSDIEKTSEWFTKIKSLDVLSVYNNQQYLLKTVIKTPWPFKDRELITCVDTTFEDLSTMISISSCSDRVSEGSKNLRIADVESHWVIEEVSESLVKVSYKTWLDPEGNIPSFVFNSELIDGTKNDFNRLKKIIESASLNDFAY